MKIGLPLAAASALALAAVGVPSAPTGPSATIESAALLLDSGDTDTGSGPLVMGEFKPAPGDPLAMGDTMAQRRGRRGGYRPGGDEDRFGGRRGVPDWEVPDEWEHDIFHFVRVRFNSVGGRYSYESWDKWQTDYPDSDLNFSYRLQQLTSLNVNPDGKILDLYDEDLFNHPFLYMIEPGFISLSEQEVSNLRRYLSNGGFLMIDDFWGYREWEGFQREFSRVFPNRPMVELDISHPVFHFVFDLKEKPQVPAIGWAMDGRYMGITHEPNKPGTEEVHFKGIFDDKGRLMVLICHNTDLGDGWEREGDNEWYFKEFAEAKSFPMGINIVFYAMTH